MEPNEVNVFAPAVFCDFQKIEDSQEPGGLSQLGSYIRKPDGFYGIHFDFTVVVNGIPPSNLDMRAHPDADAAGDVTPANSFP